MTLDEKLKFHVLLQDIVINDKSYGFQPVAIVDVNQFSKEFCASLKDGKNRKYIVVKYKEKYEEFNLSKLDIS